MQVKIGETIKELRKRDHRKQEDMAAALGVTCQAVSRWESNKGYPDMEMIPAIANYFHVTIDEHFGYNNDRDIKLARIIRQADSICEPTNKPTVKSVEKAEDFLRDALAEFPNEWKLQFRLSVVLQMKYVLPKVNSGDKNTALKESATFLEQAIAGTDDSYKKDSMLYSLINIYCRLGNGDRIDRLASDSLPLYLSREIIKTYAPDQAVKNRYFGEALAGLIHELVQLIDRDYRENPNSSSSTSLTLIRSVINLNECIYGQSINPLFNSDVCIMFLHAVRISANCGDEKAALKFFDAAYKHYISFRKSCIDKEKTAPSSQILKDAVTLPALFTYIDENNLKDRIRILPKDTADKIRNNPKYKEVFK